MAKSKNQKSKASKREVKVNDLQPEKNPSGGKGLNDIVVVKDYDKDSPILLK